MNPLLVIILVGQPFTRPQIYLSSPSDSCNTSYSNSSAVCFFFSALFSAIASRLSQSFPDFMVSPLHAS
jgi:hypothetical protein